MAIRCETASGPAPCQLMRTAPRARFDWTIAAWGGWLFLVLFGSLVAFTVYMHLIAAWGATTAGSYTHISPSSPFCSES
jgi:drug/metabolite transporter (DMT)-like permease